MRRRPPLLNLRASPEAAVTSHSVSLSVDRSALERESRLHQVADVGEGRGWPEQPEHHRLLRRQFRHNFSEAFGASP